MSDFVTISYKSKFTYQ